MTRSHKIGWLVLVIAVLFMLWRLPRLHGQGFGSFSHDQPYFAKDVVTSTGVTPADKARWWWVASDLTADARVSIWTDRISGATLTNADSSTQPLQTETNLAVLFKDTRNDSLTNNVTAKNSYYTNDCTIWFIVQLLTSTENGHIIDGNEISDIQWSRLANGTLFYRYGLDALDTGPQLAMSTWYDVAIVSQRTEIHGANSIIWYTNGISCKTNSGREFGDQGILIVGNNPGGTTASYNGFIQELAFFSDTNLAPAYISQLHTYRTNTYGGSP